MCLPTVGTDDVVDHGLRRGTGLSEIRSLCVGERFVLERMKTVKDCTSVLRVYHVVAPLRK